MTLRSNRWNNLFLTTSNGTFTAGIPQPLKVLQDSEPPSLFIDFPTNKQVFTSEAITVAGRVGDLLSGYQGLAVAVRSTPFPSGEGGPFLPANVDVGIGNNGTFDRSNVSLVKGTNFITVTASDMLGNSTTQQVTVVRVPLEGPRLIAVAGDRQSTNVHRRLVQPIVIKLTQADGTTPIANKLVDFEVTRSDGRLLPVDFAALADANAYTNDINRTVHGVMHLQLFTDANGEASARWAMGGDAGYGNNRVCVMGTGLSNTLYFCASAKPGAVNQINIGTGNNQKAETGGFLAEPLRAWVSDSCNGIEGLPIAFTVIQGGGKLVGLRPPGAPLPSPGGEG